MKRMLFVSALVVVLTVPSTAMSATESYSSSQSAKRGFNINFTVFSQDGKPKRVGNFEYSGVELTCESGGPITASGSGFGTANSGPNAAAKVENKQFENRYPAESPGGGEGSFKIFGEFKQNFTKIKGYFKVKGDFPNSSASGCRSGKLNYVAT